MRRRPFDRGQPRSERAATASDQPEPATRRRLDGLESCCQRESSVCSMCSAPGRRAHVLLDAREPGDERVERFSPGGRLGGEGGDGLVQPHAEPAFDGGQPLAEDAVERGDLLEPAPQQDDRLVVGDQTLGQPGLLGRQRRLDVLGPDRVLRDGGEVLGQGVDTRADRAQVAAQLLRRPSMRRRSSASSDSRAAASAFARSFGCSGLGQARGLACGGADLATRCSSARARSGRPRRPPPPPRPGAPLLRGRCRRAACSTL